MGATAEANQTDGPPPFCQASFRGRIGVARADITPEVGIYARNWGAAQHDVADAIHRPLTLTALLLTSDDGQTLLLVDADLGWWRSVATFHHFRDRILKAVSLQESQFVFALSHTHAAVTLTEEDPALPGSERLAAYLDFVADAAIKLAEEARDAATEAILDWHVGKCGLAKPRDLQDPAPGADRRICGFDPSAEADDTLVVGRVTDLSGKLLATLVNYACHPTTLAWENSAISPDFLGAMRATMEANHGGAPALFLQGASGELAPRYQYVGETDVADRHGRQLAFAALATLEDMEPPGTQLQFEGVVESGAPLAAWRHHRREVSHQLASVPAIATLPLKDWPTAEQLEQQRQAAEDRALEERLRRKRNIRRALGDGPTFAMPLTVWRLGEAVLVGCMGESYAMLQQELRRRFPQRTIICMNLVNGSIGYLPPAALYDQDTYQVWQTPFARGSLEEVLDVLTTEIEKTFSE